VAHTTTTAGYSGTPLARKLGIAEHMAVAVLHPPEGYDDWLAPWPQGARRTARVLASTPLVHLFVTEREELSQQLQALRAKLAPDAVLWVSWPKKASGVPSTITEDAVRELALPLGWVDVKVCAVSPVWSGLKLVVRKALR
jgi:hypothetical protein